MRIIGNDPNTPRQTQVVASGTLSTGDTIVVNSDGTVSAVAGESATQSLGSDVFVGVNLEQKAITYDTTSDKVIIAGQNSGNSNYGTACVGTVSGTSISFGSPAQYAAVNSQNTGVVYDAVSDRVIIAYTDNNQSGYLKAVVGQVSGTTMTFGSIQTVGQNDYSNQWSDISLVYDSSNNKSVMIYADGNNSNYLTARTVTVNAGTNSMTFGTPVVLYSALAQYISSTFDSTNNKVIVTSYTSGAFRCFVGTVSGTSISFGSAVSITGGISTYSGLCFDSTNGKVVVAYSNTSNNSKGTAVVGTVSGSSISFGSAVVFEEAEILRDGGSGNYAQRAAYDSTANRVVVSYQVGTTAQQYGRFVVGQVSGTSITFGSAQDYNEGTSRTTRPVSVYDPDESKVVFSYKDPTDSNKANAQVLQVGYENTNLTSENYIGVSRGTTEIIPSETGTAATYDSSETAYQGATFDSGNNKVVIGYRDYGNTSYGTAVVGTVSGTSITYGTPVVFETGTTNYIKAAYDSNAGKVVFVYQDQSNSAYATAVVGTVSGTSISFGTPVVFESSSTEFFGITFDSSNNKIVVAMRDNSGPPGDEQRGRAIVGTVSGTSISFGTAVTFLADSANAISIAYDTTAEKVVIAYQDSGDGNKGKAVVGTVSGTSISFGTAGIFESTSFGTASGTTYDPVNNKIVIAYRETTTGEGRAVVGTVSGTSITFGTPSSFMTGIPVDITSAYDTETGAVVITYKDNADAYTYAVAATVSGTSVSFSNTLTVENSGTTAYTASTYDTNANKSIATYKYDFGSTGVGKAIVFKVGLENRFPIADGAAASIDLIGAISTNQGGLTAGEKYYVQTDGTISTTAGSPSVLAGTAISATKLVVKT